MNLYVVRHGQTAWNMEHKMLGRADLPLNEFGREQAENTKSNMKDIPLDVIISSPLKRARETAEIIHKNRNIPILIEEGLIERDYGEFEGVKREDFDYDRFWYYEKCETYEKAENTREFFQRIYKCLDEIKHQYKNKNVLIVTHGGVIKAIECYFHGLLKDEELGPFLPSNASVLKYEVADYE